MKERTMQIFNGLFKEYPALVKSKNDIEKAFCVIMNTYNSDGKILVCGNGGSAADSEHIVGELMKGFKLKRALTGEEKSAFSSFECGDYIASNIQGALPAISLVSHTALMTAFNNDAQSDLVFAQQVYGYICENDTLIALSTSGNSKNVYYAAVTAKAKNGKVISITGHDGGKLSAVSDVTVILPSDDTAKIQEFTLPVYHALCAMAESELFDM